jgi:hypothetical protein
LRAHANALAAASPFTIADVAVTMPRSCASTMPAVTPDVMPKSSAVTTSLVTPDQSLSQNKAR